MTTNPLIDEILLKPDDTLTDGERETIKANKDYLNDEEKARFSNMWPDEQKPQAETQLDDVVKKAELDSYLEEKRKEWEAKGATKTEAQAQVDRVEEFLKKNGEPKNWGDTFKMVSKYFQENPDEIAPALKKSFDSMSESEQKAVTKETEVLTKEYDTLAAKDGLPVSTTKEGQTTLGKVANIMVKYKLNSMGEAYDLYKDLPVNKGGGHVLPGEKVEDQPKVEVKKVNPNKSAASLIGGGTGGDAPKKGPISYKNLRNMSMDQIAAEMLKN